MDGLNNSQKTGPLARFFDRGSVRTNPFGSNQSAHRAYRRAERLVAALYLVTNHISSAEPLRSTVRSESLSLLERVLSLRDSMRAMESEGVNACRASIRHLISLVRVLSVAGHLSAQNTNVMMDGLDELGNFLEVSRGSPLSESISFGREDFLDVNEPQVRDIKDTHMVKDKDVLKDMSNLSVSSAAGGNLSVRENSILGVLRTGGELGIRDIASNLPEYSEKMIQRDLVGLVATGRVKKIGLKRWSRYSIMVV